jgi:hypothetical protein
VDQDSTIQKQNSQEQSLQSATYPQTEAAVWNRSVQCNETTSVTSSAYKNSVPSNVSAEIIDARAVTVTETNTGSNPSGVSIANFLRGKGIQNESILDICRELDAPPPSLHSRDEQRPGTDASHGADPAPTNDEGGNPGADDAVDAEVSRLSKMSYDELLSMLQSVRERHKSEGVSGSDSQLEQKNPGASGSKSEAKQTSALPQDSAETVAIAPEQQTKRVLLFIQLIEKLEKLPVDAKSQNHDDAIRELCDMCEKELQRIRDKVPQSSGETNSKGKALPLPPPSVGAQKFTTKADASNAFCNASAVVGITNKDEDAAKQSILCRSREILESSKSISALLINARAISGKIEQEKKNIIDAHVEEMGKLCGKFSDEQCDEILEHSKKLYFEDKAIKDITNERGKVDAEAKESIKAAVNECFADALTQNECFADALTQKDTDNDDAGKIGREISAFCEKMIDLYYGECDKKGCCSKDKNSNITLLEGENESTEIKNHIKNDIKTTFSGNVDDQKVENFCNKMHEICLKAREVEDNLLRDHVRSSGYTVGQSIPLPARGLTDEKIAKCAEQEKAKAKSFYDSNKSLFEDDGQESTGTSVPQRENRLTKLYENVQRSATENLANPSDEFYRNCSQFDGEYKKLSDAMNTIREKLWKSEYDLFQEGYDTLDDKLSELSRKYAIGKENDTTAAPAEESGTEGEVKKNPYVKIIGDMRSEMNKIETIIQSNKEKLSSEEINLLSANLQNLRTTQIIQHPKFGPSSILQLSLIHGDPNQEACQKLNDEMEGLLLKLSTAKKERIQSSQLPTEERTSSEENSKKIASFMVKLNTFRGAKTTLHWDKGQNQYAPDDNSSNLRQINKDLKEMVKFVKSTTPKLSDSEKKKLLEAVNGAKTAQCIEFTGGVENGKKCSLAQMNYKKNEDYPSEIHKFRHVCVKALARAEDLTILLDPNSVTLKDGSLNRIGDKDRWWCNVFKAEIAEGGSPVVAKSTLATKKEIEEEQNI